MGTSTETLMLLCWLSMEAVDNIGQNKRLDCECLRRGQQCREGIFTFGNGCFKFLILSSHAVHSCSMSKAWLECGLSTQPGLSLLPDRHRCALHSLGIARAPTPTSCCVCFGPILACSLRVSPSPWCLYSKMQLQSFSPTGFLGLLIHHLAGNRGRTKSQGLTAETSSRDSHLFMSSA